MNADDFYKLHLIKKGCINYKFLIQPFSYDKFIGSF